MRLHLFNPDNDLALASGLKRYTPPRAAMQLRKAGEALPFWYADAGDRVLCYGINDAWLTRMQADFGIEVEPYDHWAPLTPDPWGWSAAAKNDFIDGGLSVDLLPSDEKIETLRQLSHRRTASLLAQRVSELCPSIYFACPPAVEAFTIEAVEDALRQWGAIVAKSPWSSSGRGVANSLVIGPERTLKMAADAIRRQGSVMVEQAVPDAFDFAKIYECKSGVCREVGTSVFTTGPNGAYSGNLLAPESERLRRVGEHADVDDVATASEAVRRALEEIVAPYYDGILGVDMLADKTGRIHPVVEINLRKTMGYVAIVLTDRLLPAGAVGEFTVTSAAGQPSPSYTAAGGKLQGGILDLTPPSPHFQFRVRV